MIGLLLDVWLFRCLKFCDPWVVLECGCSEFHVCVPSVCCGEIVIGPLALSALVWCFRGLSFPTLSYVVEEWCLLGLALPYGIGVIPLVESLPWLKLITSLYPMLWVSMLDFSLLVSSRWHTCYLKLPLLGFFAHVLRRFVWPWGCQEVPLVCILFWSLVIFRHHAKFLVHVFLCFTSLCKRLPDWP